VCVTLLGCPWFEAGL